MRVAIGLTAVLLGLAGAIGGSGVPPVHAKALPSPQASVGLEELATDLTDKTMGLFIEGIRQGDFSSLLDIASARFKSSYTVAQINKAFRSFSSTIVTGDPLAEEPPVFLEPPAMQDGLLKVQGFYELPDGLLLFELAFASERGDWALDGIDVRSEPIEAPSTSAAQTP